MAGRKRNDSNVIGSGGAIFNGDLDLQAHRKKRSERPSHLGISLNIDRGGVFRIGGLEYTHLFCWKVIKGRKGSRELSKEGK